MMNTVRAIAIIAYWHLRVHRVQFSVDVMGRWRIAPREGWGGLDNA